MSTAEQEKLARVAGWLKGSRSAVAFCGAGISTESGIPDFRSPGGVWSKSRPVMFEDFLADPQARREYWRQKSGAHGDFAAAEPNDGHRVLAQWEQRGWLEAVITQNIDGLHQDAGSRRVLELHGTAREIACLACPARFQPGPLVRQFRQTDEVPECPQCGGLLKHATVSFGQALPADVLEEAIELSRGSDLFLAMGSSLVVEPAAGLPRLAQQSGSKLVIVNREATQQDRLADVVLQASIGATLLAIDRIAGGA